jgi:putative polyhydroxyalkanoate system protein
MADIDIRRNHHLGLKGARVAADKMADHLGRKFDLRGTWEGNVLNFQRPGVTGSLAISDKDLALSISLGFLLKAMRRSIEGAIVRELDELFADQDAVSPPKGKAPTPKPKKAGARPKRGG